MALLLRHSRKLQRMHVVLDCQHGSTVRYFSASACSSVVKEDGISSSNLHRVCAENVGSSSIFHVRQPGKERHTLKITSLREATGSYTSKRLPIAVTGANSLFLCGPVVLARHFSSGADLPAHEAIGMPSLSPTMTEGNIARWVKKEGDKVSPGEVLCEVETDKATVEMECMEEGFLAKIVCGDGAKEIKVGEIIAITVEEEGDIEKFKDYKASSSAASAAPAESEPQSTVSDLPAHEAIGMPSLSPTMTEGNIARWVKKEGDKVSPGEVLCEVETDKATVEMECMEEGFLAKIVCGDGAKEIKVGEIIAITVEEEGDIEKFKDYKASSSAASAAPAKSEPQSKPAKSKDEKELSKVPESKATTTEESFHSGDRVFSSPVAKKLAEDNNVPLSSLKGTGPDGRILKADIEDYLSSVAKGAKKEAAGAAPGLDYVDLPNSQIRKVTAKRLLQSKQTIPHYYLTVDSRVDKLIKLRSELNPLQDASGGKKISINDLVIKAAALSLRKVPECNSSWMNDFIRLYHNVNINVAVQTEHGLLVPVVRDADKKGLATIAEEVKQLAVRARDNSLKPEDYEGGTFTVSNLGGPFGIKQFCAILNPPQSAILAIGSAEKRVISGAEGQFEVGSFMSATLSCDHRVIDGAIGAEWLKAFKGYIENPTTMLL